LYKEIDLLDHAARSSMHVTRTEENYYSIAINKSDVDDSHPKQDKKNKAEIQVNASFGPSNGDNAHTHFKEKTMRSICKEIR